MDNKLLAALDQLKNQCDTIAAMDIPSPGGQRIDLELHLVADLLREHGFPDSARTLSLEGKALESVFYPLIDGCSAVLEEKASYYAKSLSRKASRVKDAVDSGSESAGQEDEDSDELEDDSLQEEQIDPHNKLNEPSNDAFKCYRAYVATGKKQTELAQRMTEELGRTIYQGTVSRWIQQAKDWLSAGNVLPNMPPPASREQPMDPATLDMGERLDALTPRQRDRRSEDSDG